MIMLIILIMQVILMLIILTLIVIMIADEFFTELVNFFVQSLDPLPEPGALGSTISRYRLYHHHHDHRHDHHHHHHIDIGAI